MRVSWIAIPPLYKLGHILPNVGHAFGVGVGPDAANVLEQDGSTVNGVAWIQLEKVFARVLKELWILTQGRHLPKERERFLLQLLRVAEVAKGHLVEREACVTMQNRLVHLICPHRELSTHGIFRLLYHWVDCIDRQNFSVCVHIKEA